jgi:hypothetical protein
MQVTFNPQSCNNLAIDEATIPFPKPDITPPVTNINFGVLVIIAL